MWGERLRVGVMRVSGVCGMRVVGVEADEMK